MARSSSSDCEIAFAKADACEGLFLAAFCPITFAEPTVRYAKYSRRSILNFSFVSGVSKGDGH